MDEQAKKSDILIVDDNPENLRTLLVTLEYGGYRVRAAIDGPTALLAAEAQVPELILLDIRMPGMDGYEVCLELKKMPETKDVPIIFLSALDSTPDKIRAFNSGAVDYITKPFQADEVLARVRTHLTIYEQQRELRRLDEENQIYINALKMIEARFNTVLNSSDVAFTLIDPERRVILNNRRSREISRLISGETLFAGDHAHESLSEENIDYFEKNFEAALAGETVISERCLPGQDGQDYWFDVRYYPVSDDTGKIIGACLTNEDITTRKVAELAVREGEARYRTIADFSSDWTYWVQPDGSIDYMSPVCEVITGYTLDELQASGDFMKDIIHPEDADAWEMHVDEDVDHDSIRYLQFRIIHKMGHTVWLEHLCRRVVDEEGNYSGVRVNNRDITERRNAESQRLQLSIEQERVKLITRFIHDVSHEFRSPLSIINVAVSMLRRTDDAETRERKHDQIMSQTKRITSLVDGLLLMTRLDTEDIRDFSPANINNLLQMLLESYSTVIEEKKLTVKFERTPDLPKVPAHHYFLKEGLTQLVHNAIRYTPDEGYICINVDTDDKWLQIVIDDSGTGIPEEEITPVMESFHRLDSAHSTAGMGLGLPIAKRVLEVHDGELLLENREEGGLRVIVRLPLARE